MVTNQCSERQASAPQLPLSSKSFSLFGELVGPLSLTGFAYRDMCMLEDGEGRIATLGLDRFADDYSNCETELLNRLSTDDAFRIGMEWAWQRQNATIRQIVGDLLPGAAA